MNDDNPSIAPRSCRYCKETKPTCEFAWEKGPVDVCKKCKAIQHKESRRKFNGYTQAGTANFKRMLKRGLI